MPDYQSIYVCHYLRSDASLPHQLLEGIDGGVGARHPAMMHCEPIDSLTPHLRRAAQMDAERLCCAVDGFNNHGALNHTLVAARVQRIRQILYL